MKHITIISLLNIILIIDKFKEIKSSFPNYVWDQNDVPYKRLFEASRDGNVEKVLEEIRNGTNVNITGPMDLSALHIAAEYGHESIAKVLIDHAANVNAIQTRRWTPIMCAARNGSESVARLLIENGANINALDTSKWTSLHWASYADHESVARSLIENGANLNSADSDQSIALHLAARYGHESIAELLIDHGTNVNAKDKNSHTPLHRAASNGHESVVKLLIDHEADLNAKDINNQTPLHRAVRKCHSSVTKLLVDKGANVSGEDSNQTTPLHIAAYFGYEAIAKLLLDREANVDARDVYKQTPLHIAAFRGHMPVVIILTEKIRLQSNATEYTTALSWEIDYDRVENHESYEAYIDAKDVNNRTPLARAAFNGHKSVAKFLIEKGAKMIATDIKRSTPLDLAIEKACGISEHKYSRYLAVAGGRPTKFGELPWMAALGKIVENEQETYVCGGTIISEHFVLTAAHCNETKPGFVRVGFINLMDINSGVRHDIQEFISHPNYTKTNVNGVMKLENDIALIRVEKHLYTMFSRKTWPACLQTDLEDESQGIKLTVAGWGLNENGSKTDVLLNTQVTTMPLAECHQKMRPVPINEYHYCAYDPKENKSKYDVRNDACHRDSGGPLQFIAVYSHIATIVGVVSFGGTPCGYTDLPGVYSRVAYFVDWIESIVWP